MKIVDVCAFYSPFGGGVKTYADRKLALASQLGHDIALIVPSDRNAVEKVGDSARIIHLASPQLMVDRRYRYFEAASPVHAILDREQPDFVEASSPWRTASIVADWKGPAGRSLIMHADPLSTYAYRWFGPLASRETIDRQFDFFWRHLRRVSAGFDLTVSANRGLTNRLTKGGIARVATIPMGIERGLFSPARRDLDLRKALLARCGLPETATLLLGVGRHSAEKRWPLVIDACVAASRNTLLGLVIIGDGRQRSQLIRNVGANPHIHLLAPLADRVMLARVLASGDALIHGCETETFGMVAAEAAASGLPLIVPDEGGSSSFVSDGAGTTYKSGDPVAAADAISELITNGIGTALERAKIRAQAVPSIEEHFRQLFARYEAASHRSYRAA